MSYCFWDTETGGLTRLDQIFQIAAIRTDDDFNEIDSLDLRCRPLPWVTPSPEALAVIGMTEAELHRASLSHYEMMRTVVQTFRVWGPCTFIGHNTINFDCEMLRVALFQTLHPPYLTLTNGNSRGDTLRLLRLAAAIDPDAVTIPEIDGTPTFRLGPCAKANGIVFGAAGEHDALADARAALGLAKLVRDRVPRAFAAMTYLSSKRNVIGMARSRRDLVLVTWTGGRPAAKPVALLAQNASNPAEIAFADLTIDPEHYIDRDPAGVHSLLGDQQSPIPIVRANALPILLPADAICQDLAHAYQECSGDYEGRAGRVRAASSFRAAVGLALQRRLKARLASPHPELQLYSGGFIPDADVHLCRLFHQMPWHGRHRIIGDLADSRLRYLASRLIYANASDRADSERPSGHASQLPTGPSVSAAAAARLRAAADGGLGPDSSLTEATE